MGTAHGNGYGYGNGGYGNGYGYQQPIYVTTQGPTYQPPLTGYTYPVATYDQPQPYPYVTGGYGYRPAYARPIAIAMPARAIRPCGGPITRAPRLLPAIELPPK